MWEIVKLILEEGKEDILPFCLGSWASAGLQREFQAHAARGVLLPTFTSEWSPILTITVGQDHQVEVV